MSSNLARDATRSTGTAAYKETTPKNPYYVALRRSPRRVSGLSSQGEEHTVTTLAEALTAYRICAQAEGKSSKTVRWIMSSVTYFGEFLGPKRQDVDNITGNDLRQFIIAPTCD